jgi:hypothetical protein
MEDISGIACAQVFSPRTRGLGLGQRGYDLSRKVKCLVHNAKTEMG